MSDDPRRRELAFVRDALAASGRADPATIDAVEAAWVRQSTAPIRFLAAIGAIDAATARSLEAVFKGYLRVPAGGLLGSFSAPESLRPGTAARPSAELAPATPRPSRAPQVAATGAEATGAAGVPAAPEAASSEGSGVLGPIPEWNSIPEAAPSPPRPPRGLRTTRPPQREPAARIDAPRPGERIATFTLRERLGSGGASAVYRAYDETGQRPVILKVLPRELPARERERLVDEARRLARVDHPNVVRVLGAGEHQGAPYVVFEDVYAIGLDEHLESAGVLAPELLLRVAVFAVRGLDAALRAGVVHGDLGPPSLRLFGADGRVKVTDFGAASAGESMRAEGMRTLRGSPGTMAPERVVSGGPVDHRADMYSLGATLYELATGRPPFVRSTALETMRAHIHDPAPELHEQVSGFPPALSQLIARLLRKRPQDRFAGWSELLAALAAVSTASASPIADAVSRAVHGDAVTLASLYSSRKIP